MLLYSIEPILIIAGENSVDSKETTKSAKNNLCPSNFCTYTAEICYTTP